MDVAPAPQRLVAMEAPTNIGAQEDQGACLTNPPSLSVNSTGGASGAATTFRGIRNAGAFCYDNASLQLLRCALSYGDSNGRLVATSRSSHFGAASASSQGKLIGEI